LYIGFVLLFFSCELTSVGLALLLLLLWDFRDDYSSLAFGVFMMACLFHPMGFHRHGVLLCLFFLGKRISDHCFPIGGKVQMEEAVAACGQNEHNGPWETIK